MFRLVRIAGLCCLLTAVTAFGQHGGGGGGHGGGGFGGGGGFHGGGGFSGGGFHGGGSFGGGFRGGEFRGGFGRGFYGGYGRGFYGGYPWGWGLGWGWGGLWDYPWDWGWDYGYPYGYPAYPSYGYAYPSYEYSYPAQPVVTTYAPDGSATYQPSQPAKPVVINQYFNKNENAPPAQRQDVYFSIALHDGTVYTALAYWVQDGSLHFVDTQGNRHRVAITDVDEPKSENLNRQRGVDFGLPR